MLLRHLMFVLFWNVCTACKGLEVSSWKLLSSHYHCYLHHIPPCFVTVDLEGCSRPSLDKTKILQKKTPNLEKYVQPKFIHN